MYRRELHDSLQNGVDQLAQIDCVRIILERVNARGYQRHREKMRQCMDQYRYQLDCRLRAPTFGITSSIVVLVLFGIVIVHIVVVVVIVILGVCVSILQLSANSLIVEVVARIVGVIGGLRNRCLQT